MTGNAKQIANAMLARGFLKMPRCNESWMPIYYRDDVSEDVIKYASFRYLTTWRAYDVRFGVEHSKVREALEQDLPCYLLRDLPIENLRDFKKYPCLSMFPVNHYLGWGHAGFPASIPEETKDYIAHAIDAAYNPLFLPVTTADKLLALLIREDPPFGWGPSNVLFRMAQIAYLVVVTGRERKQSVEVIQRNWKYFQAFAWSDRTAQSVFDDLCDALVTK